MGGDIVCVRRVNRSQHAAHTYIHRETNTFVHTKTHAHTCTDTHICAHIHTYVHIYIYIYVQHTTWTHPRCLLVRPRVRRVGRRQGLDDAQERVGHHQRRRGGLLLLLWGLSLGSVGHHHQRRRGRGRGRKGGGLCLGLLLGVRELLLQRGDEPGGDGLELGVGLFGVVVFVFFGG